MGIDDSSPRKSASHLTSSDEEKEHHDGRSCCCREQNPTQASEELSENDGWSWSETTSYAADQQGPYESGGSAEASDQPQLERRQFQIVDDEEHKYRLLDRDEKRTYCGKNCHI